MPSILGVTRIALIIFCLAPFHFSLYAADAVEVFVSPQGDDGNPGTFDRPLRTVNRARNVIRVLDRSAASSITVYLRGGTYSLSSTLTFLPADSGTSDVPIVYSAWQDEKPVISGGRPIEDWEDLDSGIWRGRTKAAGFRQLYINGDRAIRARGAVPKGIRPEGPSSFIVDDAKLAQWQRPRDLELVFDTQWERNILKVWDLKPHPEGTVISMLEPYYTLGRLKEGMPLEIPTHLENAKELLDEPGEWYFDQSTGEVYYIPRPGERPESSSVVIPIVETLLKVAGTVDNPVHDIQFRGITFAYAGWLEPSRTGLVDFQANFTMPQHHLLVRAKPKYSQIGPGPLVLAPILTEAVRSPANICLEAAKGVAFTRCVFTHLGGAGIDIGRGSQENLVVGSVFEDIAGTAIQVGDVLDHHPLDPRLVVKDNTISNCLIRNVANQYWSGVGIFVGYTDGTVVSHNEITNLPYTGVSVGWGWGEVDAGGTGQYYQPVIFDKPAVSKNNKIINNLVHHVLQELWDGAGIYTLGRMPGTVIEGNHIHDNPGFPGGIYLDEGSGAITVTGNLIYNVETHEHRSAAPIFFNNRRQDRIATCIVKDNHAYERRPERLTDRSKQVAARAGLEPAYRDIRGQ